MGEWGFSRPRKHNKQRVWAGTFITGTCNHDLGTFSINRERFAQETPYWMQVDILSHAYPDWATGWASLTVLALRVWVFSLWTGTSGLREKNPRAKNSESKEMGTIPIPEKEWWPERFAWISSQCLKHHQSPVWLCLILSKPTGHTRTLKTSRTTPMTINKSHNPNNNDPNQACAIPHFPPLGQLGHTSGSNHKPYGAAGTERIKGEDLQLYCGLSPVRLHLIQVCFPTLSQRVVFQPLRRFQPLSQPLSRLKRSNACSK